MSVLAVIGVGAMYLLFGWLACAIIASLMSSDKGYGERPGLSSGLLLPPLAVLVWVALPARDDSAWKINGPSTLGKIALGTSIVAGIGALIVGFVGDMGAGGRIALIVWGALVVAAAAFSLVTNKAEGHAPHPAQG